MPTPSAEHRVFGRAQWIWPESPNWDLVNGYALFRKRFKLAKVPTKAPLFITADQSYRLYVNGRHVARGPARGYQENWPYDQVDVSSYLQKGYNLIAVRAYNPGFSTFRYLSKTWAGLLVAARWGDFELNTGSDWKCIRQPGIRRDTVVASLQLFPQEHADLRITPTDWTADDFDDQSWLKPACRAWNTAPWFSLEARDIPMLDERDMRPALVVGENAGKCAAGFRETRDVVTLRQTEDRAHRPTGQTAAPASLSIPSTGKNRFHSVLLDFGKTVVGSLDLRTGAALGGEIVDLHMVETIDHDTLTPHQRIPLHNRVAIGDRVTLRAGDNHHAFFHIAGFRYLMLVVRDSHAPLSIDLTLNWVGYPLPHKGAFHSSDTALDRIWQACAWTQQSCSLDAYVDTPWREQVQWWGDARVQAWNTFHLNGDTRLFRRGIAQIAQQTTPDGVTYGHAPTMAHNCILPDFTLIWMLTLWDYYWQTGSTEVFERHLSTVDGALDYFRAHTDEASGLITCDTRFWLFLDWTGLFKDGAPALYNLWLLIALEKMAELHRRSGNSTKAKPFQAWAARLRVALGHLINADGLMRDGIDRKGRIVDETSIHSQTLALAAGIKGIDADAALGRIILPWLRGETQPKAKPSAYWITYVYTLLIERGLGAEVVAHIREKWAAMAEYGSTWEDFAPELGRHSHSHAWSAHPLYHLMQTAGGIRQSGPAWESVVFEPILHGDAGGATIPSPKGKIVGAWKRDIKTGAVRVSLSLPRGVTARVRLPGLPGETVTGRRAWRFKPAADR